MSNSSLNTQIKIPKVAIIIPCYKASKTIRFVVKNILKEFSLLDNKFSCKIILIDDFCPERSWLKINNFKNIKIIHNKINLGVGGATLNGMKYALKRNYDILIKLDADAQHSPNYLRELIPFIHALPPHELHFSKGTRYKVSLKLLNTPLLRRIGTLFLDPLARLALSYRDLSDITNGFIGLNSMSAKFLIYSNSSVKIEKRYLFESSLLAKCSELEFKLNQFCILPQYGDHWYSSMNAFSMIVPLLIFWLKTALARLLRKYFFNWNLGSLLLLITFINSSLCIYLFFESVLPVVKNSILVTAGTSSAFIGSGILSIVTFTLFLLYDYGSGLKAKTIFFEAILDEYEYIEK